MLDRFIGEPALAGNADPSREWESPEWTSWSEVDDLVLALASTHTGDGTVEYVLNETGMVFGQQTVVDTAFESYTAEDGVISIICGKSCQS